MSRISLKNNWRNNKTEFKIKGNTIRYEENNNILEKIDDTINSMEEGHIERCKKKLKEVKALFLKQRKLTRIADMEEDGWEVVKRDSLASDSGEEKHLN